MPGVVRRKSPSIRASSPLCNSGRGPLQCFAGRREFQPPCTRSRNWSMDQDGIRRDLRGFFAGVHGENVDSPEYAHPVFSFGHQARNINRIKDVCFRVGVAGWSAEGSAPGEFQPRRAAPSPATSLASRRRTARLDAGLDSCRCRRPCRLRDSTWGSPNRYVRDAWIAGRIAQVA